MEEELQESEVIFPENIENDGDRDNIIGYHASNSGSHHSDPRDLRSGGNKPNRRKKKKKKNSSPIPVNIPENNVTTTAGKKLFPCVESDILDEDDSDGELEPPHVIVGRRKIFDGKMAFSVCSGNGRTLKGRDLSQVRNSILRMTGFLET